MITITEQSPDGDKSISPETFPTHFGRICQSHRAQDRALVFGVLLYDLQHPQIVEVLQNEAYWNCLDDLSGSSLTVFSFHSPITDNVSHQFTDGIQSVLSSHFDVDKPLSMPSLLLFQIHDNEVIDSELVSFEGASFDASFHELRDAISGVVTAVSKVKACNSTNSQEIFDLVRNDIQNRNLVSFSVKAGKNAVATAQLFLILERLIATALAG